MLEIVEEGVKVLEKTHLIHRDRHMPIRNSSFEKWARSFWVVVLQQLTYIVEPIAEIEVAEHPLQPSCCFKTTRSMMVKECPRSPAEGADPEEHLSESVPALRTHPNVVWPDDGRNPSRRNTR